MTRYSSGSKPFQFRLPAWVAEYVEERSAATGATKTDVIVEAVECLRDRETQELMREGYREIASNAAELAEEGLCGTLDDLPEW